MDLLQRASDWLERKRTQFAARMVRYERDDSQVDVLATIGKTVFETTGEYGVVERTESRDFLVLAADLILDGQVLLPERGDRLCETQGTTTFVYEVMAPGREPHWRYSDPYRTTLRIHTKQTDTEPFP
jgi:hypothetical protein